MRATLKAASGSCLVVSAPAVSINLAGHTLIGTNSGAGAGIALNASATGAIVRSSVAGAVISSFGTGIEDDANGATIDGANLAVDNNVGTGVFLHGASGSVVRGVTVDANARFGIYLQGVTGAKVHADTVQDNQIYGIWVQSSPSAASEVTTNTVTSNGMVDVFIGCNNGGNISQECGSGTSPTSGVTVGTNTVSGSAYGIAIGVGNLPNKVVKNTATGDTTFDLADGTLHCRAASGANVWKLDNPAATRNQTVSKTCIG